MPDTTKETKFSLRKKSADQDVLRLVPESVARKYNAFPLSTDGKVLRVAMSNPADIIALEALASRSQMRIEPELATVEEVSEAIDFNYKSFDEIEKQISNIEAAEETENKLTKQLAIDTATEAPVAQALNLIIDEAVKARASDIHLEPGEDKMRVRFRIDGALQEMFTLPLITTSSLISRIKIMASMNIADHQRPQDGQFSVKTKGRVIDIRVAMVGTVYGEMAVLRLLDKTRATLAMTDLGFLQQSQSLYEKMLKVPYGVILVSGPTGAGKTTTLYASVNSLNQTQRNIVTIEDPVEYRFSNINQIQVNPRAGVTFASGLRSILRLDPDVILIGEIRDAETASIAIQSALTGHLVLSSIHANDAVGVVLRLIDLGVEPFLVSSALIGVVAQRMVRRLCSHCARPMEGSAEEALIYAQETGEERKEFLHGVGCKVCANSGYRGRTGIFEILFTNDEIKTLLVKNASAGEIRHQAIKEGMTTLLKDGMLKVKKNVTTPAEVIRNAYTVE
jgi:general secretion pathway protein E